MTPLPSLLSLGVRGGVIVYVRVPFASFFPGKIRYRNAVRPQKPPSRVQRRITDVLTLIACDLLPPPFS
jgi:hypothetical protein